MSIYGRKNEELIWVFKRNRVVLDYKKFDSEIDIEDFKNIYENITDIHDFSNDISGDEEYFTIKYI